MVQARENTGSDLVSCHPEAKPKDPAACNERSRGEFWTPFSKSLSRKTDNRMVRTWEGSGVYPERSRGGRPQDDGVETGTGFPPEISAAS